MNNIIRIFIILLLLLSVKCYPQQTEIKDVPHVTLEVRVKSVDVGDLKTIKLSFIDPILGKDHKLFIEPDSSGYFKLDIPIVFPSTGIVTSEYFSPVLVFFTPNSKVKLDVNVYGDNYARVEVEDDFGLSMDERLYMYNLARETDKFPSIEDQIDQVVSPDLYKSIVFRNINNILSLIDADKNLSNIGKALLKKEFEMYFVVYDLMNYESSMAEITNLAGMIDVEIPELDLSYYSFLKDLNLSDTATIRTQSYPRLLLYFVNDAPVPSDFSPYEWVETMKSKLNSVVGDNQDLFYDILLAYKYGRAIENGTPLNKKQMDEIKSYYKNNDIAKILLYENGQLEKNSWNVEDYEDYQEIGTIPDEVDSIPEDSTSAHIIIN